ncbi:peptidoglycan DD-metalloendopeptidase family protein [Acinetobacter sp. MD2]|uniref:peptidoglycan DD-metalloendopeptidase family protein n=1 Tax=Acinetobacter sp. MD2 TaxID=2600066 RepID=UPI002D1EB4A8|nr:peptidoglycan DD-metalloendopeptidase family protein [Acinetobacter sp. MD2]MEB3766154.1 peptidoglycan DD-metalloendopeptidase family protein [Acinetobacter sp. MD2]
MQKLLFKTLFYAASILYTTQSFAQLPQDSRRPGGIAIIQLAPTITQASLNGQPVIITQENNQKYAVLGIPLSASLNQPLQLQTNKENVTIQLQNYPYAEQHITLKNQDFVSPSAEQLARYQKEAQEQTKIYQSFTTAQWQKFPSFIAPTQGKFSNSFGRKRFFNGEERAPHSGLDIPAPIGQKVIAPADGIVVGTGNYFFNGNTILVDHGQGMISMFCHLSKVEVRVGQRIHQGEEIGLVGKTGRVTGPHLHWGMSLNNARVDPQLFLAH